MTKLRRHEAAKRGAVVIQYLEFFPGLLCRFTPRNDETSSSRGREACGRGDPVFIVFFPGLLCRFTPRNDETSSSRGREAWGCGYPVFRVFSWVALSFHTPQ